MRLVIAPNAFKECLSAPEVAKAMAAGARKATPDLEIIEVPLADGGDGTTEALVSARQGRLVEITARDPLMRPVAARYGLIDEDRTAVIEMAAASGLWHLQEHEKNPMRTTTYGTGEMIRDALDRGVDTLIVGIGGSATTDAGLGMAAALGYRLLDRHGNEIEPVGGSMASLASIDSSQVHPRLRRVKMRVASDVNNPLLGPQGAAPVYGPQKGATPDMIRELEMGLANVARCWDKDFGVHIGNQPGGGAAGGLGAGLVAFCGAEIRSGLDLIADYAGLDEALRGASLALTGEGKIDASTRFGKVPAGVARRAEKQGVPVVALAGHLAGDVRSLLSDSLIALFSITPGPMALQEAMASTKENLERTAEQVVRLWSRRG
ncbi:MAG: glycerate kinase [bacterium]